MSRFRMIARHRRQKIKNEVVLKFKLDIGTGEDGRGLGRVGGRGHRRGSQASTSPGGAGVAVAELGHAREVTDGDRVEFRLARAERIIMEEKKKLTEHSCTFRHVHLWKRNQIQKI